MSEQKPDELECVIEALLFAHGEPVSVKKLAGIVGKRVSVVKKSIAGLKERLKNQNGLRILEKGEKVQLVTAPDYSLLVEKLFRAEHREELSRAALEVLAIVAYAGPVTRAGIEAIRGVNSAYTIRGLMLRGLIENNGQGGAPEYDLSFEAAQRFGIQQKQDLPEWGLIRREIENAKQALTKTDEGNN